MAHWTDGFKDSDGEGPLDGIRVLDLGRYQAGPRCGLVFARLGADVIKIEPPGRGDESRPNSPHVRGQSAYWVQYNSGKSSLTLNLRTEEGKAVLRDLIKQADVLIQNFRPGTIDKMGFGYDVLKSLNKKIVMVNVSAYGQYGPLKDRVGFDQVGQAMSGLMSLTGDADGEPDACSGPLIRLLPARKPCSTAFVQCSTRICSSNRGLCQRATSPAAYTPGAARQVASHTMPPSSVSPDDCSHPVAGSTPTPTTTRSASTVLPSESLTRSTRSPPSKPSTPTPHRRSTP